MILPSSSQAQQESSARLDGKRFEHFPGCIIPLLVCLLSSSFSLIPTTSHRISLATQPLKGREDQRATRSPYSYNAALKESLESLSFNVLKKQGENSKGGEGSQAAATAALPVSTVHLNDEIVIHVCDEARKVSKDFKCSRKVIYHAYHDHTLPSAWPAPHMFYPNTFLLPCDHEIPSSLTARLVHDNLSF